MFNIVVDDENTGKQLLQNGDLQRRVTIIPLNKIQSNPAPTRIQHAAAKLVGYLTMFSSVFTVCCHCKCVYLDNFLFLLFPLKVGKENAKLALSLVGYDEELKVCL